MSYYTGTVHSVVAEPRQANVVTAAAAGSSTLLLDNVGPFREQGGQAFVDGVLLDYLTIDGDLESMTLAAPLAASVEEDSTVQLALQGVGVLDWTVNVVLDGQEGQDEDPVPAVIPHELIGYLREGFADAGKVVTLSAGARGLFLDEIDGGVPLFDGSTLDPGIPIPAEVVPAVPPGPPPAPTATPELEPLGLPGAILLQLQPVNVGTDPAVPAVVDIYMSASSPVNLSDPGTFHGTATAGSIYRVAALPDGTPLSYDTNYYFVGVAHNAGGDADPSGEATGSMRQIDGPDVSVNAVWAGWVAADRITSGTTEAEIVLAGVLESRNPLGAEFGRVGISQADGIYSRGAVPAGGGLDDAPVLVHFPTNGAPNIVSGIFEAEKMTVTGGATFRATTSLETEAELVLEQGVQPPKAAPSVVETWHSVQLENTFFDNSAWEYAGLTVGHDGRWVTARARPGSGTQAVMLEQYNADGSLYQDWMLISSGYDMVAGVVYASHHTGRYYLLIRRQSDLSWFLEARDTGFNLVKRTNITTGSTLMFSAGKTPVLGWDHVSGRLLTAAAEHSIWVDSWTAASDGTLTMSTQWVLDIAGDYNNDLGFVTRATTEQGDRLIVRQRSGSDWPFLVYSVSGTTTVRQTNEEWLQSYNRGVRAGWLVRGATAADDRFWSMNPSGNLSRYGAGRMMWTSGSNRFSFDYRWFDSETARGISIATTSGSKLISSTNYVFGTGDNGVAIAGAGIPAGSTIESVTAGTGNAAISNPATATGSGVAATLTSAQQETGPSPRAVIFPKKRAQLTLTFAAIPPGRGGVNDPKGIRYYHGRGDTDGATTMVREDTLPDGQTSISFDGSGTAEGGTPATAFGNSTPARFRSAAVDSLGLPLVEFQGDGFARADMLVPPGVFFQIDEATAPKGWGICDGREYPQAVSPVLASRWGTGASSRYGAATTGFIRMPDRKGRISIGASSVYPLRSTDGNTNEANRKLQHVHGAGTYSVDSAGSAHDHGNTTSPNQAAVQRGTGTADTAGSGHTHAVGTTGSGHVHNSLSGTSADGGANAIPYVADTWIVKF